MIFSRVVKPTAVVINRGHSLWQCANSSDKSSPATLYFFLMNTAFVLKLSLQVYRVL